MSDKVSIIIPCYNQSNYLNDALSSVFAQSHANWECIIIDDGSTDKTQDVAAEWVDRDERFRYFYKQNGGLSSARNAGLKFALGDYIQFLDADDLIKPNKLSLQILDLADSDVAICNYIPFRKYENHFIHERYLSPFFSVLNFKKEIILDWELKKSIPCHAVLFRKKIVFNHRITFDESLSNHEDWVFWVMLFYFAKSIKNRKEYLSLYRIHDNSMSTDYNEMRKGFEQAAGLLKSFFKNQGDIYFINLINKKHQKIRLNNLKFDIKIMKTNLLGTFKNFIKSYVKTY